MINMCNIHRYILIYLLIAEVAMDAGSQPSGVPIGLVLNMNSPLGSMLHLCIEMALSDVYAQNPNYTTMLQLHIRNAQSVLEADFAVVDLLENEQVEGLIGPQGSTQDIFISELGKKSHVPIVSITARSSSAENNFFVRATIDDLTQARALAALCQELQWPQAVLLYEDAEYAHQFQSHLSNAFRDVGIGIVHLTPMPWSADHKRLTKLLTSLEQQETRVFIVHMNPSLGFRLFDAAKKLGLMREGSVWVITDSLSNFLSSMDSGTRDSMEGVVGVRPYVAPSKELRYFQERWERNSSRAGMDLNVYGLWAYDTITALASAVENLGPVHPQYPCNNDMMARDSSSYGPRLLRELLSTRFRGLSGYFEVVDGRLKPSDFEIVNLIGTGERRVGFWNPHRGIVRDLNYFMKGLKNVVWPGDSTIKPKGWAIPPSGSLRVGVPWKPGFKEFVNVEIDPATNETRATGFAVDIFLYALKQMPFPINYTFCCYNESSSTNWSYDSMLREIPEKYDMVVADTTIWAPRASYVDFTLPYSESGLVLVVKNNKPLNMWTFTKPLRWDLWVTIVAASLVMGLFIWRLERADPAVPVAAAEQVEEPNNNNNNGRLRIPFLAAVLALAFPEMALVRRNTSVFVLVCWLFTAFVLMQSYTANLSAILTLDQLHFSFSDDHFIGYHRGSFTYEFLTQKLNISPARLKSYLSLEEYHHAMRKGSHKGGIDAIFDEYPYMKLLINRYYSRYKIVGPTFRTDGLGFALPLGSPLVAHFSRAILNVTQGPEMTGLEQKNFGPGYSSQDPLINSVSQGASSLTSRDFAGLFIILAGLTLSAFLAALTDAFNKLKYFVRNINGAYAPLANQPAAVANAQLQDPPNREIEVART
ncbi:glutamate receptor 2.8-like [Salvia miltiorrhiza]|uniref:glutamate receptor 2.8-like n=1 Tax=Salvia miltiorrhiza TaxID=226208 RepID=UPI0025AD552B|nr:glutamate receptor 2.8-like [Salvia miltiorrhiza]